MSYRDSYRHLRNMGYDKDRAMKNAKFHSNIGDFIWNITKLIFVGLFYIMFSIFIIPFKLINRKK